MADSFSAALAHVLIFEGGFSDHPTDPGGPTNMGITQAVLARARGRAVTRADVERMTRAEAADIYRTRYWAAVRADDLPAGLDLAAFDCAVNQGVATAARLLQRSLGGIVVDGRLGPVTMAALAKADPHMVLGEFMARRMQHYAGLRQFFPVFGLGWSRRLMATHRAALELMV